jgi:hypothetical protein
LVLSRCVENLPSSDAAARPSEPDLTRFGPADSRIHGVSGYFALGMGIAPFYPNGKPMKTTEAVER